MEASELEIQYNMCAVTRIQAVVAMLSNRNSIPPDCVMVGGSS